MMVSIKKVRYITADFFIIKLNRFSVSPLFHELLLQVHFL